MKVRDESFIIILVCECLCVLEAVPEHFHFIHQNF